MIMLAILGPHSLTLAAGSSVQADFFSRGTGIDRDLYDRVVKILEIEKDHGHINEIHRFSWGIEGEKTLCFVAANRKHQKRLKTILDILSTSLTRVATTDTCNIPGLSMTCSDEINPWGNPGVCECPQFSTYHPAKGICDRQSFSGIIHYDGNTFTMVSYDKTKITELRFPEELLAGAKRLAARSFPSGVSGSYLTVYSQSGEARLVFLVTRLHVEE